MPYSSEQNLALSFQNFAIQAAQFGPCTVHDVCWWSKLRTKCKRDECPYGRWRIAYPDPSDNPIEFAEKRRVKEGYENLQALIAAQPEYTRWLLQSFANLSSLGKTEWLSAQVLPEETVKFLKKNGFKVSIECDFVNWDGIS